MPPLTGSADTSPRPALKERQSSFDKTVVPKVSEFEEAYNVVKVGGKFFSILESFDEAELSNLAELFILLEGLPVLSALNHTLKAFLKAHNAILSAKKVAAILRKNPISNSEGFDLLVKWLNGDKLSDTELDDLKLLYNLNEEILKMAYFIILAGLRFVAIADIFKVAITIYCILLPVKPALEIIALWIGTAIKLKNDATLDTRKTIDKAISDTVELLPGLLSDLTLAFGVVTLTTLAVLVAASVVTPAAIAIPVAIGSGLVFLAIFSGFFFNTLPKLMMPKEEDASNGNDLLATGKQTSVKVHPSLSKSEVKTTKIAQKISDRLEILETLNITESSLNINADPQRKSIDKSSHRFFSDGFNNLITPQNGVVSKEPKDDEPLEPGVELIP